MTYGDLDVCFCSQKTELPCLHLATASYYRQLNMSVFYVYLQKDYMALEVINGNVVLKYDLGSGPAQIRNTATVNDNQWHEVIVERYGKLWMLRVK